MPTPEQVIASAINAAPNDAAFVIAVDVYVVLMQTMNLAGGIAAQEVA